MTSPQYAFVTLVTSDHYLPGALVVAAALKDVHKFPPESPEELAPSEFHRVCLVTPETVNVNTIKQLRKAFDVVVGVEVIEQENEEKLALLGRPDLKAVLTKLHVFRLTSYLKIIFLDADVLPLQPISHLFRLKSSFAAVPDVGWPDIFNSGFFVAEPSEEKFNEIMNVVKDKGSWDGGDQGVLNEWVGPEWERLSFAYNTTPTAVYTYAPAYKRFGPLIKNIHFIGPNKPWNSLPFRSSGTKSGTPSKNAPYDFRALLDCWFDVYDKHYRPAQEETLSGFPTIKEVPPGVTEGPLTHHYINIWDAGPKELATIPIASVPLGLEELRRMAVEGTSKSETGLDLGEGVYRTMPLEDRIDLMRPPKIISEPAPELQSPQGIRIVVPEGPQTPIRSFQYMTTLPTPGPNELPPAPHLRGQSLPPETPTYSRPARSLLDTPSRSHLQPVQPNYSPSPLSKASSDRFSNPPSPPLLIWDPAVEEPPKIVPPVSNFPQDTYFPNAWDAPSRSKYEVQQSGLFAIPPPAPIPEMLIREGHYKNVIGDSPSPLPSSFQGEKQSMHDEHRDSQAQQYQEAVLIEPHLPQPDRRLEELPTQSQEAIPMESMYIQSRQTQQGEGQSFPNSEDSSTVVHSDQENQTRHAHGQSSQQKKIDYHQHKQNFALQPSSQPSYPKPDRTKVTAIFPWEQKPRPAPERFYPRTDSPPPGQPFIERRPLLKIDIEHQATRVFKQASPTSVGGFPRTTSYANAWDVVPSIQRYAARLVRPSNSAPQLAQSPVSSGRSRKGSGATATLDDYRRRQEMEELNNHDADDEDEDDEDEPSVGGESDRSIGPSRLPPQAAKIYKVKGVQTVEKTMKDQSVQVQSEISGGRRSRPTSGRKLTDPLHIDRRELPSQAQTPSTQVPELSPSVPKGEITMVVSPYSTADPASPPDDVLTPRVPSAKSRPPGRKFDPARGVDVFKRGSEEVLARFLKMDSWEEQQVGSGIFSAPGPGTPTVAQ